MRHATLRHAWWSGAAMATGLIAGGAAAQPPADAPQGPPPCERTGLFHRFIHHSAHTLHDKFIGYPENFIEPPLGAYVREQMTIQVAKADTHRFTLYRSDFLPGADRFSPTGASRFNLMYARLAGWLGPVVIEWTPDDPGLAEARRAAVLATLQRAGCPIIPERVVIGPSPYPGAFLSTPTMGTESVNNLNNVLLRSQQAEQVYPASPQATATSYSSSGSSD